VTAKEFARTMFGCFKVSGPVSYLAANSDLCWLFGYLWRRRHCNCLHYHKLNVCVLLVYLRADPEVCYRRLKFRDRKEEAGVPLVSQINV